MMMPFLFRPCSCSSSLLLSLLLLLHHHPTHIQSQAVTAGSNPFDHFETWMQTHQRTYSNDVEKQERFQHWLRVYERVQTHTQARDADPGQYHYTLGLNAFSDWSPEEHHQRFFGSASLSSKKSSFQIPPEWRKRFHPSHPLSHHHTRIYDGDNNPPPSSIDWRYPSKNPQNIQAVTPIRNQYYCGGCYAFAVSAAVEGVVAADQGFLNQLSEEQIIDCDTTNNGCQGGDPQLALQYVVDTPLVARADYPYTAGKGLTGQCLLTESDKIHTHSQTPPPPASQIQNFLMVKPCEDEILMQALARGPVVMAIDASCADFMSYAGGIITFSCTDTDTDTKQEDEMCESELNHAMAIVGYGSDEKSGLDYWLVKNQWGASWGEKGYARIARTKGGGGGESAHECGLGCMTYYNFLPVGGVAFVNGTVMADDDYPEGEEAEDEWVVRMLTDILGAVGLGLLVFLATSVVQDCVCGRRCRRRGTGGSGSEGERVEGGLKEPLLELEEEEEGEEGGRGGGGGGGGEAVVVG